MSVHPIPGNHKGKHSILLLLLLLLLFFKIAAFFCLHCEMLKTRDHCYFFQSSTLALALFIICLSTPLDSFFFFFFLHDNHQWSGLVATLPPVKWQCYYLAFPLCTSYPYMSAYIKLRILYLYASITHCRASTLKPLCWLKWTLVISLQCNVWLAFTWV